MLSFYRLLCTVLSFVPTLSLLTPTSTDTTTYEIYDTSTTREFEENAVICSTPQCEIICDESYGCFKLTVDASESDSLSITCSALYSCSEMEIISSAQISTDIDCLTKESCKSATFDLNNSPNVNLNCYYGIHGNSDGTCTAAHLNASLSTNVNVDCVQPGSCEFIDIVCPFGSSDTQCNVTCSSRYYSCKYMSLYIQDEASVNLFCAAYYSYSISCDNANIHCGLSYQPSDPYGYTRRSDIECSSGSCSCTNDGCCPLIDNKITCDTADCTVDCTTTDCSRYLIDGASATSLTINCAATSGGCEETVIRCPSESSCSVNCQDNGSCKLARIRATNAYSLDIDCSGTYGCAGMEIDCPYSRVGACSIDCSSNDEGVCSQMIITVDDTYTTDYLSLSCPQSTSNEACFGIDFHCDANGDSMKQGIPLVFDSTNKEYECNITSSVYCCPWSMNEAPVCESSDCDIDCGLYNCYESVVNASDATSLNLECGNSECKGTDVYCPPDPCIITCKGVDSCRNMRIYANETYAVTIHCDHNNTCDYMQVYADSASYLTFGSSGSIAYESTSVKIYANNTGSVDLNCKGAKACYWMNVYADFADSVVMNAAYLNAFSGSEFYASHAGSVSISCSSLWYQSDSACRYNKWYLPDYGVNTNIYCYGECNDFNIYVDTSVSSLIVNINGCDSCSSASSCTSYWEIFCKSDSSETSYSYTDDFYGDSCHEISNCDCPLMVSNVVYSDDSTVDGCIASPIETNTPPVIDSKNSSFLGRYMFWIVLAVIVFVLLGALICLGFLNICKRKSKDYDKAAMTNSMSLSTRPSPRISHPATPPTVQSRPLPPYRDMNRPPPVYKPPQEQ